MIQQIRAQELKRRLDAAEPTLVVDVRQPWEHEVAAIPGSVLVPLDELQARLEEVAPSPGALVVVYCHHGMRSLSGAALLAQHGAVSLLGGIDAWSLQVDPSVPRY